MSSIPAFSWWPRPSARRSASAAGFNVVDAPTDRDLLGYRTLADPVARHILSLQTSQTPLTIGIYGQWGTGKTSFLRMVDSVLQEGGVKPIWFHAWKYEREENLWAALIQTIVGQGTVSGSWLAKIVAKLRLAWRNVRLRAIGGEIGGASLRIAARVLFIIACALVIAQRKDLAPLLAPLFGPYAADAAVALAALAAIVAAKPDALLNLFSAKIGIDVTKFTEASSYQTHIAFLDNFTKELREIIAIAGGGKPVVIVIDDLDRCLPEKALQVLEAMKMFLDVEGAVFLFAVEPDIVQSAVAKKYGGDAAMADPYLEKLIHLSFTLLPLRQEDIENLIEGVCDRETARWAKLFAVGLPANPRTVKRTLQMFDFMKRLAAKQVESGEMTEPLLAKMIVIHEQCREIWSDLPRFPTLLEEMEKLARDPQHAVDDATLGDRARQFLGRDARLRELLAFPEGTFVGADVQPYLRLLRSVRKTAPAAAAASAPAVVAEKAVAPSAELSLPIRMRKEDGTTITFDPEVLLPDDRVLLVGGPGTGKTALLRAYQRGLDRRLAVDPNSPIPVYIALGQLGDGGMGLPLPDAMRAGDCCVLIDGIDESPDRSRTLARIANMVAEFPTNRYVVASRPVEFPAPLSGFAEYAILRPTPDDIDAYVKTRIGASAPDWIADEIFYRGLITPLLVQLVVQHGVGADNIDEPIRAAVDDLVERIQLRSSDLSPAVARRFLAGIAGVTDLNEPVAESDALRVALEIGLTISEAARYLEALSAHGDGILFSPRPGLYQFGHHTIHQVLSKSA